MCRNLLPGTCNWAVKSKMPGLESEEADVPPAKEEVEGLSNRALNRTPVDDTVVLRAEAISDDESKALTVIMSVGELLAVGILVAEVALKFTWVRILVPRIQLHCYFASQIC